MVTVAIQDERRLFREGLALVVAAEPDMRVVGTAGTGADLVSLVRVERPDVAVLAVDARGGSSSRVVAAVRASGTARVVALYGQLTRPEARELHAAGVGALVDRKEGVDPVFEAIRGEGPARIDVTVVDSCRAAPERSRVLTAREIEVLGFVGKGITSREISELLGISRKTVENYKQRTFQKLGVQNQAHAVSVAMRQGLFAPVAAGSG